MPTIVNDMNKQESQLKKSLRLMEEFLTEKSSEEINEYFSEIDEIKISGPTFEEYIEKLNMIYCDVTRVGIGPLS